MGPEGKYTRALLKLSGNAFAAPGARGFDEEHVSRIARELADGYNICPELAVVVGGGNIMRGAAFSPHGDGRIRADYAGMVATIINALVLQDELEKLDIPCCVYSALPVADIAKPFSVDRCVADLEEGCITILAGGTGNPLFTTDTAAALRGVQLGTQIILKATRVDGVYSADPEKQADAQLFDNLAYEDVLKRGLAVMDLCAVSICMEHALPVRVFNYKVEGNISRALQGEPIGTLIGNEKDVD